MKEVARYKHCFVCGEENPGGLKAKFLWDGKEVHSTVIASPNHEGYNGIYHGGIVASLLDEVMVKAILALGHFAVTAEMTVRYKKPVRIGETIHYTGRIIEQKGRLFTTEGEAVNDQGELLATATARYLEARAGLKAQLQNVGD
ncbi:MAG: PaaI family thioesterase [bacterium]|nr:PaaI family thioesterase [bacterium]